MGEERGYRGERGQSGWEVVEKGRGKKRSGVSQAVRIALVDPPSETEGTAAIHNRRTKDGGKRGNWGQDPIVSR